jgi:hypothetical protein
MAGVGGSPRARSTGAAGSPGRGGVSVTDSAAMLRGNQFDAKETGQ